jgi:hypothetical protein
MLTRTGKCGARTVACANRPGEGVGGECRSGIKIKPSHAGYQSRPIEILRLVRGPISPINIPATDIFISSAG